MASRLTSTAQVLGLTSASILSACIASISIFAIPAIQMAPAELAVKQWSRVFHLGMSVAPPFAIACSVCFAYLSYQSRNLKSRLAIPSTYLYGAAAILAPSIVPYTRSVMWTGIQALESRALGQIGGPSDQQVWSLIEIWSRQNLNRSFIVAGAGLLSAIAMLA